jgi:serine/threonine protein kinase
MARATEDAPRESNPPSWLIEGRFLAVDLLGTGDTSEVFSGSDTWSGQLIAVRILRPDRPHLANPFRRLSERLFGLSSARVVRALHCGDDRDDRPFLVTELLVGRGVERVGRVRWEVACEISRQGALALAEMHLNGLTHGDVRPSTLFVAASSEGGSRVKLLDLGKGDRFATTGNDRAALAGVLHFLLTGSRPRAEGRQLVIVPESPPELATCLEQWLDPSDDGPPLAEVAATLREMLDPDGIYGGDRPSQPIPELLILPKSSPRVT